MNNRDTNAALFRQKSLKRFSSPEELNQYIKSTSPSVWILLASFIILLTGVMVWAVFGKIDSACVAGCVVENGELTVYLPEADQEKIREDSYVEIEGDSYTISAVEGPILATDASDSFLLQAAQISSGEWFCLVKGKTDLKDGKYKGKVIFEQISPITFIMN